MGERERENGSHCGAQDATRETDREERAEEVTPSKREREGRKIPIASTQFFSSPSSAQERERAVSFVWFFVKSYSITTVSQSVLRERMGACCGKASSSPGYSDYQTADREKMLQATEARVQKQEARGVTARGAAKLKDNATKKHHAEGLQQDTNMKWTVG